MVEKVTNAIQITLALSNFPYPGEVWQWQMALSETPKSRQ